MNNEQRRPILYKGEVYNSPIEKQRSFRDTPPKISFEESRVKLMQNLEELGESIRSIPKDSKLPNETIVCVRVQPEYVAKSFYPDALFGPNNELDEIGSRAWRKDGDSEISDYGRLYFARTTDQGISNLQKKLNKRESEQYKNFCLDIRKVSEINLLSSVEKIVGFNDDWQEGRIEAILHPFNLDRTLHLPYFKSLIKSAKGDVDSLNIKQYNEDGVIFISLAANREVLKKLEGYNPLRTAHPLTLRDFPDLTRSVTQVGSPKYPKFTVKSPVVVGVIDGGYVPGNPALDPYVEVVNSVPGKPLKNFEMHGTLVTSAALYGPLHNYSNSDTLSEPTITVRNFRVLSEDTKDPDLFCVIDAIEEIVPKNLDIQCYNLSVGPTGPILDDPISRFTYACDTLSKQYNVLFHTAPGNHGEKRGGYDRIQSPSDMVNGLAVGAHTLNHGKIEHAPYSCKGPGREGNKMKPDITALAGCDKFKLQLVSIVSGSRTYITGTSFASPQSTALSGKLIGGSKGVINPLTSRLLTIHSAALESNKHCVKMGHGPLPLDIQTVMNCVKKSYTLIYEGELPKSTYREYEIPWDDEFKKGNVTFKWTIAVLTSVDHNSPEDYSSSCVEVGFYPNSKKYVFSKVIAGKKKTKIVDIEKDTVQVNALINDGWSRSGTPHGKTTDKPYPSENELRRDYLKWDTIDNRQDSLRGQSVNKPVFQVHALTRGRRNPDNKVKFAIALTVEAPKASVDIYQRIRAKYGALVPINMEIQATVPVTT